MKLAFYCSPKSNNLFGSKSIIFFVLLFFLAGFAQATTITSTTSGNWNAGSTWVGGVAPSATDDVVIASGTTVTVTANATARSLVVYGTIVENTGLTFTINGDLDVMSTGSLYLSGNTACNGSATNYLLVYGNYTNYGYTCFYKSTVIITGDLSSPSASALQNNGNIVVGGDISGSINLTGGTGANQVYALNPNATVSLTPAISTGTDISGEAAELIGLVNTVIYGSSCGFAINGTLNVTSCEGGTANFVISSTTANSPTYQWYENQGFGWAALSNGGVYSGVTTATLTISNTTGKNSYNYRCGITDNASCSRYSYAGTLTNSAPVNTAGAASTTPTLCSNAVLTNITHTTTGSTGIGAATGLPSGVSASWATNTITISGTPTVGGTFNYSIPLTGGCGSISATGTITVNGTNDWTGAVDTDWYNLSNWTCRVPTAVDDVVISATTNQPVLGASANVKSITINTGGVLTLNSTSVLNVYGDWTNNGTTASFVHGNNEVVFTGAGTHTISGTSVFYNLTADNTNGVSTISLSGATSVAGTLMVESTSTFNTNNNLTLLSTSDTQTGSIGNLTGATLTGNVTAQRYMSAIGNTFRYVASPLVSVLPPATWGSKIYAYNYSGAVGSWVSHATTSPITGGQGFTIRLNMTAPVTWEVSGTVGYDSHTWNFAEAGWHLIGNPFPSPIEWSTNPAAWTSSNVSTTIAITDNSIAGYPGYFRYYDALGGVPVGWGTSTIQNGIITMGQAFWIYVGTGGGSLTVYEAAKNSSANSKFYRTRPDENPAMALVLSNGKAHDVAYLDQHSHATDRFDLQHDVMKFRNEGMNIYLMDHDQNRLMKQSLSEIGDNLIPVGVEVLADGNYEIAFHESDQFDVPLYWIDTYEQKSIVMGNEPYKVNLTADATRNRFYISTQKDFLGLGSVKLFPNPVAHVLNMRLQGDGHFTLLDSQGQVIQTGVVQDQLSLDVSPLPAGIYLIKISTATEMVVRKIVKQ